VNDLQKAWLSLTVAKSSDPSEAQREYMTRVVLGMTLTVVVIASLPVIIGWGIIRFDLEAISIILLVNTFVFIIWLLAQKGYWRFSSYLPPAMFFMLALYGTYVNGMLTAYLIFYVVAILLTFMLQGVKAQWFMLILTLVAYLSVSWLHNPMVLTNEERLTISITVSCSFIGVALLIWFATRELHQALSKAQQAAQELQGCHGVLSKNSPGKKSGMDEFS